MADDPFVNPPQQSGAQQQQPHIYRPIPRRIVTSSSHNSSESPDPFPNYSETSPGLNERNKNKSSDFLAQLNARLLRTNNNNGRGNDGGSGVEGGGMGSRQKSLLNMTSSTLYGIYDEAGVGSSTAGERSVAETPWGTGAETPARGSISEGYTNGYSRESGLDGGLRMKSAARRGSRRERAPSHGPKPRRHGVWKGVVVVGKLLSLFAFGSIYGVIVAHLHDTRELAAVQVGGVDRESWMYLTGWGLAGLVLGSLLPYVDLVFAENEADHQAQSPDAEKGNESSLGEQWNEVVRSVGAFVGIAFAIRRLPWQSTLQLTLTLALVNPALWYILDRSKNGLSFSLITTSILTSCIFLSNPDVLPSPALPATTNATHLPSSRAQAHQQRQEELFAGVVSYDNLATATWVGSVVFCSCICFGGIGRRLAVLDEWGWKK